MIRSAKFFIEDEVIPQAIFWRPLRYFTSRSFDYEDGLDIFEGAPFCIGNTTLFDLRKYRGHPEFTVTLYLSYKIEDVTEILSILKEVIGCLALPSEAIGWKRGQDFRFGELERSSNDYLREKEARVLALKIAALSPSYTASTEYIKKEIPRYFKPSERDMRSSPSRKGEKMWQQIVGNVVSHKDTSAGPFKMGYAERTTNGLKVTKKGLDYLNSMGFSV